MKKLFYLLIGALFLASCNNDDKNDNKGAYDNGVFVVNEGPFLTGTGTLTFIDDDGTVTQQVFEKENNNTLLGNIAQSMIWHDGRYYIVVNNANKIVVADKDMKAVGEITGLHAPRYMVASGGKAYVSEWGQNNENGGIAVIDLSTLNISKRIPTGNGPEILLLDGNRLFVPNGGSYDPATFDPKPDSTVSVIDLGSESVTATIPVKYNPNSICRVTNGYLVAAAEKSYQAGNGNIYTINRSDLSSQIVNGAVTGGAGNFAKLRRIDDSKAVVISGGYEAVVLNYDASSRTITGKNSLGSAYAADYDEDRNLIYVADAKDFTGIGEVKTYSVSGQLSSTFAAGIIPGSFCFR